MAALTRRTRQPPGVAATAAAAERRRTVLDSLAVSLGGQLERILGIVTSLVLRWGLDPARLGVYTGLRLYLDQTNRTSLGISLGAVQEIPILRAAGRAEEARRLADIAYTTNSLTCLAYAGVLCLWAWLRRALVAGDPLAAEWTWGLVAVAGLTLLKRYESFLTAVLRAHGAFLLTTELDVLEAVVSLVAIAAGLAAGGFWGLLAAAGVILGFKIAYLHARHPLRFRWCWDLAVAGRLLRVGLPILANTAVFGAVLNVDRVLILWRVADGARAVGLYSIALLGTSWSLDLAGRLVLVLYTAMQTTLGRTCDRALVARQAALATEAQATPLAAGSAVAYMAGPLVLGWLLPRYADGLPALRPLLPGMVLLGLAWPARQSLITVGRPYRLCLATTAGLLITTVAGWLGAGRAGLVGVAWGMTLGYAAVYLLTSAAALAAVLGWRGWIAHLGRLAAPLAWFAAGAGLASQSAPGHEHDGRALAARSLILAVWMLPAIVSWGRRHHWGGLIG